MINLRSMKQWSQFSLQGRVSFHHHRLDMFRHEVNRLWPRSYDKLQVSMDVNPYRAGPWQASLPNPGHNKTLSYLQVKQLMNRVMKQPLSMRSWLCSDDLKHVSSLLCFVIARSGRIPQAKGTADLYEGLANKIWTTYWPLLSGNHPDSNS